MRTRVSLFRCSTDKEYQVRYAPTSTVDRDYENLAPANLTPNNLYDR